MLQIGGKIMAWNSVKEKKDELKKTAASKIAELRSSGEPVSSDAASSGKRGAKDLNSGMEMLEITFLLSVIEVTEGEDPNDVTMRKLTFNELFRRQKLDQIDSNALKVYAVDEDCLYGKTIQCEAIKELTKRLSRVSPG